jgi:hypothetical protein
LSPEFGFGRRLRLPGFGRLQLNSGREKPVIAGQAVFPLAIIM